MSEDTHDTFVGFWPTLATHGDVEEITLDSCGRPDEESRKRFNQTILNYSGNGWKMLICADYLSLIHLVELEPSLRTERSQPDNDLVNFSMEATRKAWPMYVEALNAWYFLMFASCNTGRNHSFLHDFAELSFWDCSRVLYSDEQIPLRHSHYGRATDPYLRRFGLRSYENPLTFSPIDHGIFSDAAYYWDIVFDLGLVPMASLGSKLVSEHRLNNYRVSVALAWFEIESWIFEMANHLGIQTKTKNGWDRRVADVIKDFPNGTTVGNVRDDLHKIRKKRNKIVHDNAHASIDDSMLALELFLHIFKMKSGLCLNVHYHAPPTIGLA